MKSFMLNDTNYDTIAILKHRLELINRRDAKLLAGKFDEVVFDSITIGLLYEFARELSRETIEDL